MFPTPRKVVVTAVGSEYAYTLRKGNGFCGVVPLHHGLDLLLELGLPHIDIGYARIPDAFPHPVVSLYLLPGELLVLPHVDRLLAGVGVHLRATLTH
jgi:hypothetical protein